MPGLLGNGTWRREEGNKDTFLARPQRKNKFAATAMKMRLFQTDGHHRNDTEV